MSLGGQQLGPWDVLSSVKVNDLHTVVKYLSPDTGLQLVHANIEGPNVHAYCIIAHKCEDDSGIPHVLQHMILHGSKKYPHSGLLHKIASKCFSTPPKIEVEKDHACYSFTSAGRQGFSTFLPVFLDHIFNPLLHEAVFIADVYHIDENGHDGGRTCFSAMKEIENEPDELSTLTMFRMTFGPYSGYSASHMGVSSYFRAECNLKKVRQFHDKFYHTSNCCLVVVGDIEKEELFRTLSPILQNLLKCERVKPTWTKPWLETPLFKMSEQVIQHIEYPYSFIERPALMAHAHVKVGLLGPRSTESLNRCVAMRLILEYLTSGPLQSALAVASTMPSQPDKADGIFSIGTKVTFSEYEFKQTFFSINFTNVPLEVAPNIPEILRKTMTRELKKNGFKIRKMFKIILDFYQEELNSIEDTPEVKIAKAMIPDFLYASQDIDQFHTRINSTYTIHHFLNQNVEFWKNIIKTCFLNVNWITVIATPSQMLHDKLETDLIERIEWRLEGENIKYTKRWAQRLKAASKLLAKNPPVESLNKFFLPSSNSVGLVRILRQNNPSWAGDTMCNLYVDDINSNYAYLSVILDTSELTFEQRKYLVLFAEGIMQAPYMDNMDKFHSAKESQKELNRDVLSCETCFGLEWMGNDKDKTSFSCGTFSHLLCLRLKMEITKVKEGFYWAQMLLWNTKWHAERLKDVASKLIKDIDELQNQPSAVARAIMTESLYHMTSNPRCVSLVRQKPFLRQLVEELTKTRIRISKVLESIRNSLLRPENVTVHFAACLPKMEFHLTENPDTSFVISELFRTTFNYSDFKWDGVTKRLSNIADRSSMKHPDSIKRCCNEQIFPIIGASVGHLIQAVPGIASFTDPEYPMILTALQYFVQRPDGPLYREVVETGLAEDVSIYVSPLEGLIYFEMRACPNLAAAYVRTFEVVARHLLEAKDGEGDPPGGGSFLWDSFLFQSAKSSTILQLTQEENTPMRMAMSSLLSYYKGISLTNSRDIMDAITKASIRQVQNVARKYLCPLFLQPSTCAATVPSDYLYPVIEELMQRCGKKFSLVPPLEQSFLASFNT